MDDGVVHCRTKAEALLLKEAVTVRLEQCGLELHPQKTKIVYCQDASRCERGYPNHFDFLGFCFRPRLSRTRAGKYFVNFSPAISAKAKKSIYKEIRSWQLQRRTGSELKDLAQVINPAVRGWIEYYGAFFRSELLFLIHHLDRKLCRWVTRKYKKRGANLKKAQKWLHHSKAQWPNGFAHWQLLRV